MNGARTNRPAVAAGTAADVHPSMTACTNVSMCSFSPFLFFSLFLFERIRN